MGGPDPLSDREGDVGNTWWKGAAQITQPGGFLPSPAFLPLHVDAQSLRTFHPGHC